MSRTVLFFASAILFVAGVPATYAQTSTATPATARPQDRNELRRHIYVMEGALVRAVSFGAQQLNREIRSVVPEMFAVSGEPQARGVYLDGYGVYFDVGVPILHQTMIWSLRNMLGQDDQETIKALDTLKAKAKAETNPTSRAALENAIMRIELSLGPLATASRGGVSEPFRSPNTSQIGAVGAAMVAPDIAATASPTPEIPAPTRTIDRKYLQDPNALHQLYTDAVQNALIDAMLDYSLPITIAPDEFLTVAARENMQRDTLAPPDPTEVIVTILYKIRGTDLLAYRKAEIDRVEIRKRIQILEF